MTLARSRLRRVPRWAWIAAGAALVVVLAVVGFLVVRALTGPSSPGPVTFTAGAAAATTGASQFCDQDVTECGDDPEASAVLRVPPGTPLQVTVPPAVASTPWQIAFTYRDAGGVRQEGRTPVFAPNARSVYSLLVPGPPVQLESAEVQQYGARLVTGPQGVGFTTRATWVLSVDDR